MIGLLISPEREAAVVLVGGTAAKGREGKDDVDCEKKWESSLGILMFWVKWVNSNPIN